MNSDLDRRHVAARKVKEIGQRLLTAYMPRHSAHCT